MIKPTTERRLFTALLTFTLVCTVPVPYFLLVIAGLEPAMSIFLTTIQLVVFEFNIVIFVINGVYCIVYVGLFLLASILVTRALLSKPSRKGRLLIVAIVLMLWWAAFLPIYTPTSHNGLPNTNIVGMVQEWFAMFGIWL